MTPSLESKYNHYYSLHCKHLKLQGLQPKTIEAYSRAIRRIAVYFNGHLDNLSQDQLLDYFHDLLDRLSWSAVKLDLYGLKFFYTHVLAKPWADIPLVKPPRCTHIPDIAPRAEAQRLFMSTGKLNDRVFYCTLYSNEFASRRRLEPGGKGYRRDCVCIFAMQKAIKIVWYLCPSIPCKYFTDFGYCTGTQRDCSPIVHGGWKVRILLSPRLIAVVFRQLSISLLRR